MTTPARITRKLPGIPLRSGDPETGPIDFRRGTVAHSSERMQFVDMVHPEHKRVILLGATYLYWCPNCQCTVYEHDVTAFGSVVQGGDRGTTNIRICPFCATWGNDGRPTDGTALSFIKVGTKLRLHYRFGQAPAPCTCHHKRSDHTGNRCSGSNGVLMDCPCTRYAPDETADPQIVGEWWAEIVEIR